MSNYQKELDRLIENLNHKPSLLLHACCGPCSSYVLEYLSRHFSITVLFYNPNIYPREEYDRRLEELKKLYQSFPPVTEEKVQLVELAYNPEEFYEAVGTRENAELAQEKEKGERCRRCYELRLKKTYAYAIQHHFDYFCTTLSISPFKDAEKINVIGKALAAGKNLVDQSDFAGTAEDSNKQTPKWLPSDFKKKGGFKRSLELSEQYGMYRQQYCGCVYSKSKLY